MSSGTSLGGGGIGAISSVNGQTGAVSVAGVIATPTNGNLLKTNGSGQPQDAALGSTKLTSLYASLSTGTVLPLPNADPQPSSIGTGTLPARQVLWSFAFKNGSAKSEPSATPTAFDMDASQSMIFGTDFPTNIPAGGEVHFLRSIDDGATWKDIDTVVSGDFAGETYEDDGSVTGTTWTAVTPDGGALLKITGPYTETGTVTHVNSTHAGTITGTRTEAGTLTLSGNNTHTGTETHSGASTYSGALTTSKLTTVNATSASSSHTGTLVLNAPTTSQDSNVAPVSTRNGALTFRGNLIEFQLPTSCATPTTPAAINSTQRYYQRAFMYYGGDRNDVYDGDPGTVNNIFKLGLNYFYHAANGEPASSNGTESTLPNGLGAVTFVMEGNYQPGTAGVSGAVINEWYISVARNDLASSDVRPQFLSYNHTTNKALCSFNGSLIVYGTAPIAGQPFGDLAGTGGVDIIGVVNAATAPTSNVSGGFLMYGVSGDPSFRTSSGEIITLNPGAAVADATDASSTTARLNDLLARIRAIGLIAT